MYASVCLVNVVLAQLFLPETKDKPLPEGGPERKRRQDNNVEGIDDETCECDTPDGNLI